MSLGCHPGGSTQESLTPGVKVPSLAAHLFKAPTGQGTTRGGSAQDPAAFRDDRCYRRDPGRPGPARGGCEGKSGATRSAPPARPPGGWARAARAVRVSCSRGPSPVPAPATCAESRGFPGRHGPPRGGRGTAPRAVPPGRAGGGAAREAAARRPKPRPAGGGPAPRPTCGKERTGRAREGPRGGGRGVRTPLAPTGCGAAGRAWPGRQLAVGLLYLHTGRAPGAGAGPWGREGFAAAAEVGPGAGDGPALGSQVTR